METDTRTAIDECATTLIRIKARQLVGRFGFTKSDQEDIEQDLALHVLRKLGCFDPRRGSPNTFVDRIVQRRIISILRRRYAQRADYRRTVPLDEALRDADHGKCEPVDERAPHADARDTAVDLAETIESLDVEARELCRLLMQESVAEAARRLALTRAQVRTRIARIRRQFGDAGLDIYLD